MYMNRETGELLSYRQMKEQFQSNYDGDDPTNGLTWREYFSLVDISEEELS